MKHFLLLKEHRLIFEVAPKGPREIKERMTSLSNLDALNVTNPNPEKNAGTVRSITEQERKPVVEDATRLAKAAAAAKGLENAGAGANKGGPKSEKPADPEATTEKPSKLAENVKKASNEIKEVLKDGTLKQNLAELLKIWKEFMASLKGKDVPVSSSENPANPADAKLGDTKAEPAVSETKPVTPDDKKEAVTETNNTSLETTVRTELEQHVAAKPGNNTDTYIASKKEVLPAHQSRLADLEARKAGIEKNLSKLNDEDKAADQKMLDIINEEIAEEQAAIKSIEQVIETVNALKEQAEAKAAVLNQLLDGFRTTTNPDMQAALEGVVVSVQPDLSFKMNFSPEAEAALNRAAKTAKMEAYKGLEKDVIRDLEGFVTYIGELLTTLEATTPATPEAEGTKGKNPEDADRGTGETPPEDIEQTPNLSPAKDAPIGQIRQDNEGNHWQKTDKGWASYNNSGAGLNSDPGFKNTTWGDSLMDERGVKIITAPEFVGITPETNEKAPKLSPAAGAPIDQIRQDNEGNHWQKTDKGWVSYNEGNLTSREGFKGVTWGDSLMDERGVKIIEATQFVSTGSPEAPAKPQPSKESAEATERLQAEGWARDIQGRADRLPFYNKMKIGVNENNDVTLTGTPKQIGSILGIAFDRDLAPSVSDDGKTITIDIHAKSDEHGYIGDAPDYKAMAKHSESTLDGKTPSNTPPVVEAPSTKAPESTKPISTKSPEVTPAKSEAVTNLENTLQNIVNLMKSGEFGEDAAALEELNSSLSELSEADLEDIKDIFIEDVERTNDKNYDIFYDEVEGKFVMEPTYKDLPITKDNDDAKNTFNGADLDKATERASMA